MVHPLLVDGILEQFNLTWNWGNRQHKNKALDLYKAYQLMQIYRLA